MRKFLRVLTLMLLVVGLLFLPSSPAAAKRPGVDVVLFDGFTGTLTAYDVQLTTVCINPFNIPPDDPACLNTLDVHQPLYIVVEGTGMTPLRGLGLLDVEFTLQLRDGTLPPGVSEGGTLGAGQSVFLTGDVFSSGFNPQLPGTGVTFSNLVGSSWARELLGSADPFNPDASFFDGGIDAWDPWELPLGDGPYTIPASGGYRFRVTSDVLGPP